MIGTIRRHSALLWWVIVVVVIVSFVFFFSPNQPDIRDMLGGDGAGGLRIDGRMIRPEERTIAYQQARLSSLLRGQRGQVDESREAAHILFLRDKMRQLGIAPGDKAVAAFIQENLKDPQTGQSQYENVIQAVEAAGFTKGDYFDYVRYQIGLDQMARVLGVAGRLVTPQAAEAEFRRENRQAVASAVFFSSSNHLAAVQVTPEGLGQFFTNRAASYRTPERKQLAYIKFATTNYAGAATAELAKDPAGDAELERIYTERGPDAFRDDQGQPMSKEAAIARLKSDRERFAALSLAQRDAVAFYNDLAQGDLSYSSFERLAADRNLAVGQSQPFAAFERAPELAEVPSLQQAMTRIDPTQPFSEPLPGNDGIYLVALRQVIPSEIPPLDALRVRVTEDYRRSLALDAARAAGAAFHGMVTNGLAAGQTFAQVAGAAQATVVDLPPFSLSMNSVADLPPQADLTTLKNAAFALEPGAASGFVAGRDGGLVLFLKEYRDLADELVQAGLAAFLDEQRQQGGFQSFSTWFGTAFARSGLAPEAGAAAGE